MILVVSDLDEVLRSDKGPVAPELAGAIARVGSRADVKICIITGAPAAHVPPIFYHVAFAESGAVRIDRGGSLTIMHEGALVIRDLREMLGITKDDGLDEIKEGSVIIEEPRFASLTLLFGRPPHYPGISTSASSVQVLLKIEDFLHERRAALHILPGVHKDYEWIDVTTTTKEATIGRLLKEMPEVKKAYYLGDGRNDLAVMRNPNITPVGFANSIPEIRELAYVLGIYISYPGPEGGALEFFGFLESQ